MNDSAFADIPELLEIRRYVRGYAVNSKTCPDLAVLDDLLDVTVSIYWKKRDLAPLTCKPTTFAVAIFKRQLKAYCRNLAHPRGSRPKGRPRAERFQGKELEQNVRSACRAELRARGLSWKAVRASLYPHLKGSAAIRTQLVVAVELQRVLGVIDIGDRQLAAISLLAGCFPRIDPRAQKSIGQIFSSEIEAIRQARARALKRMSEEIEH